MTKQEQIEEMAVIGCVRNPQAHTAEECAKCDFKQGMCNAYRHAETLYNAGYGDISEYKTEREMLGSQIKVLKQRLNDKYIEIDRLKAENETYCKQINQAYDTGYDDGYESCQDDIKKADELLKEYEK